MNKYIPAEKLIAEIERLVKVNKELKANRFTQGIAAGYGDVLSAITSLQQEQPECVAVPRWCLESIENTLRIQHNLNLEKKTGETCQDRNVRGSLNQLWKLLGGEELTGMERLEPLKEQPEVDLEKELNKWRHRHFKGKRDDDYNGEYLERESQLDIARHFAEWGAIHLSERKED